MKKDKTTSIKVQQQGVIMDKQEKREEFMKQRIFSLLSRIEQKSGKMAHEIPELMESLKKWQDGEIKSSYFNLTLCTYFDHMDIEGENEKVIKEKIYEKR